MKAIEKRDNMEIIKKLESMKVSSHWFLDADYSDEFCKFLTKLKDSDDLDRLVNENKDEIFYEEEKQSWKNKLIFC